MIIDTYRNDIALKQKKGIHFIIASVFIWIAISIIQLMDIPVLTKNLYTLCCATPLVPLAFLFSKILHIEFSTKNNPLTKLGLINTLNQMLYMLIVMWVYPTVPEKMIMVLAMIFGAHLLPFCWVYRSISYAIFSISIPIVSLLIGCNSNAVILSIAMIGIELLFSISLFIENHVFRKKYTTNDLEVLVKE